MLVLSRKIDEAIVAKVGGIQIVFRILRVSGNRIRIGVEASDQVVIAREECFSKRDSVETQ